MKSNIPILALAVNAILYLSVFCLSSFALSETGHNAEEKHREGHKQEHQQGHIRLTQEQIKNSSISLSRVNSGSIREMLPVYGVISRNAEHVQSVSARFNGIIRTVTKRIGDPIRKGEVLATIEANDSLKTYPVRASLNGVVTQRNANIGEQSADRVLFIIADLSTVWIDLSLFPKDLAKVKVGQSVLIKNTNNSITGQGPLIYIAPLGNRNQATIARVLIDNPNNLWKPGLFVNAAITLSETASSLVITNAAVQRVNGKPVVFVQEKAGFEPRPVTLGRTDGAQSEVLAGLNLGETYVSKNSFTLKSELGKESAEHGH